MLPFTLLNIDNQQFNIIQKSNFYQSIICNYKIRIMSIIINSLSYIHPDRETLFQHINLSLQKGEKAALVGNNGTGKSTLIQIIAGFLSPSEGEIILPEKPYYVPQHLGQYDEYSVAQALGIDEKLKALHAILNGDASDQNLTILDDDWSIEERISTAFSTWKLEDLNLSQSMKALSGGEKTKVFLSGMSINTSDIILLDEPSNHLDIEGRNILYEFISRSKKTMLVVSHDRTLLNLLDTTLELSRNSIEVYGGNYDFYAEQKMIEKNTLISELRNKEKSLRKAKETERETTERQQKLDARGKKKQEKAGMPTIMMKTLKNKAEKSTARLKDVHTEKIENISQEVGVLRKELFEKDKMKVGFDNSSLHKNKILINAKQINFGYDNKLLWQEPLDFTITSGERIAIKGTNGSGKTTLIKIILGEIQPKTGELYRADSKTIYIDQNYSLINNTLTVYEQAEQFNDSSLQEHEIKIRLNRFLFTKTDWDKPCSALSGGERMRLMLCCLTICNQSPDIIILDEPTNNLDIQNSEILTNAISEYEGTLIVVSHDIYFLKQVNIEESIILK